MHYGDCFVSALLAMTFWVVTGSGQSAELVYMRTPSEHTLSMVAESKGDAGDTY
jgi:hypothetical protein